MCYPVTVTDAHTQCPTGGLHTELMAESSALSFFFSLMWTIFKVFNEFVTISLVFYVLAFWQ